MLTGDNDSDYNWSSEDEDHPVTATKSDQGELCPADYDDDFEHLSLSSADSLCDDDEGISYVFTYFL